MKTSQDHSQEKLQSVDCEEYRTTRMRVIGLQNLGYTSYLNSVLQNLLYLHPFREQLINTMIRTEYKLVPKKQPELETLTFFYSDKKAEPGKLTEELFKLIKETAYQPEAAEGSHSKESSKKVLTPRSVQNEIARKHRKFSNRLQQDSHELLRILIDMVKEEEIKRLKAAFLDHFDIKDHKAKFKNYPEDEKNRLRKYASEFENIFVFTGTFIDETFGGKMISTVKCDSCRKLLRINEDFLDISLDLLADSKAVRDSLEFYLVQFFSPKVLEKEYVCNNCNPQLVSKQVEASDTNSNSYGDKYKKKNYTDNFDYDDLIYTNAVKQFHIKTVGPVLTIHLKRFFQAGNGLQKLIKPVEFPLVLDMSLFCFSDTSVPKDYNNQILYGLRGIVEHCTDGEYVAYVNIADWNVPAQIISEYNKTAEKKTPPHFYGHMTPTEEWYSIKNSLISRIEHDEVFSSQAYILFYERLPLVRLVSRNRIDEIVYNSESITYKSQERPNPSLDESNVIENKLSDDCKDNETKRMNVIGLQNLGNSCYLNSILQNLLYLRPFRDQLIHTMTRTEYKLVPEKHPYLKYTTFSYSKKDEPSKLTRGLFKLIKTTDEKRKNVTPNIVMPWAVQNEIADKSGRFSGSSQQDSHELFRFLIDMLKEEERQQLKTNEFGNISLFNNIATLIDDTFGGKIISTVKCKSCKKILYVNEDFMDISLPLPIYSQEYNIHSCNQSQSERKSNSEEEVMKRLNYMSNDYPKDSLEYYLMRFFSLIFLEEDYVCNYCNPQLVSKHTDIIDYDALKFTSAFKQFHIKTVGPVLTIHLKRFSQTGNGLQKLNKRVEFPLELDMSPFCVSDTSILKDCNNQILYGLRGIVEHSGGMVAGHYAAYVNIADWNMSSRIPSKDIAKSNIAENRFEKMASTAPLMGVDNKIYFASENNVCPLQLQPTSHLTPHSHLKHVMPTEEWYYISDSYMYKTDHDHVFSSQAYMLFYERLPLVTRDRVDEIGKKHNNISESLTCDIKDAINKIHEKPKPSLSQSYFIEKKQPVDYEGGLIKSMCVIGLYNLGNSCFLNSVLQNLLYLRPFRNQLTYTMVCTEYKLVPKKHSNLETKTFTNSDKNTEPGKLTRELFKLIQEATNEKSLRKNVTPKITTSCAVRNEIVGKPGKFPNGLQQDSHELFHSLINMVKDEEIKRLKAAFGTHFAIKDDKTQFKNCSGDKKYLRKYASEFENSFVFNGTFIDDTFGGKMISRVNCSVCNNIIDVFEDFLDISLPLPSYIEDNKNCIQEDNNIEYYLKQFFSSPKLLEKDYACSNCNPQLVGNQENASYAHTDSHKGKSVKEESTERIDDTRYFSNAYKQFRIKTLAPVLTIHLQRFYRSELGLQKVSRHVKFPLVLDMSLFCASDTSVLKDCDGKILYGLRGIVDHTSGITAGHYVAYVNLADWDVPSKIPSKDNTESRTAEESSEGIYSTYKLMDAVLTQHDEVNKLPHALESNLCTHVEFTEEWYFISDSSYHETDRYHVLNSQAYILFYERLPIVEGCTEL